MLFWAITLPAQPDSSAVRDSVTVSYREVFKQLVGMEVDPSQFAEVENLILQRDAGRFNLQKGRLYLCKPVMGQRYAAVFQGKGTFNFTPTTRIEREHLARFYKTTTLNETFESLFLFFVDSTLAELQRQLTFREGKRDRRAEEVLDYAQRYLYQKKEKYYEYSILKTLLEEAENGYFYSHFSKNPREPFFFEVNPHADEEVRFKRRLKGPSFYHFGEVINQFHTQEEYASGADLARENNLDIAIHSYRMDCSLEGNDLKFSADTEIEFESLYPDQNWLVFFLFSELEVDSIFWDSGQPARYIKEEDSHILWIKSDHPLPLQERRRLRMYYHGKLIERAEDWFYIRASTGWYPRHGERERADFDITYHVPEKFDFASAGDRVDSDTTAGIITSRWRSPRPLRNFSFNVGFFKEYRIVNDSIPPTTIYMAETGHQEIAQQLARQGIGSGKDMEKQVGKDVEQSIAFFQEIFGATQADHFYATEIPFRHGEAFPGLIHLPWETFQFTRAEGFDEMIRAHEVAHQWWGIGVDFLTYHDQWLSEGFSQYCALWYLHQVTKREEKNDNRFYNMLEKLREQIINNRKFLFGSGQEAAPIWLGRRTHSSDTEGDYLTIIYHKGAWVLHMLNRMMLDLETLDEGRFREMMGAFYRQHFDEKASTEDFIAVAEKNYGEPLNWFFEQWVYGSAVPTYHFASRTETTADGSYLVHCRVRQSEVPAEFRMPVMVGAEMEDGRIIASRHWVSGESSEFELGPFPKTPKKILFNHLESVLCDVKEERW